MASWRKANIKEYAYKHGKPDMERLGLFIEMPYLLGKYQPISSLKQRGSKRMLADGPKIKDGWGWCYFDKKFKRIFEGEAIVRRKKKKAKEDEQKKPTYMPPAAPKPLHGSGEQWGTFAGIIPAVDWRPRLPKKGKEEVKVKGNLMTNPGKKGGYGYVDICFNKYPEHLPEPYPPRPKEKKGAKPPPVSIHSQPMKTVIYPHPYFDENPFIDTKGKPGPVYVRPKDRGYTLIGDGKWIPVGPAKWQGGCHDGCFEPFPPYTIPMKARKIKEKPPREDDRQPFVPHSYGFKTMFVEDILGKKVNIGVNATNYKVYEPTYIKYLM